MNDNECNNFGQVAFHFFVNGLFEKLSNEEKLTRNMSHTSAEFLKLSDLHKEVHSWLYYLGHPIETLENLVLDFTKLLGLNDSSNEQRNIKDLVAEKFQITKTSFIEN